MPRPFCRTLGVHCCYSYSVFSIVFVRQFQSRVDSALGALHAASSPWPAPPHVRLASSQRRWRPWPPAPACLAAAEPPWQPTGDGTAAQRRSAPPIAPLLSAWPHACQRTPVAPSLWPGKHGTCSLPPTGPRRPVLSTSPIAPNPSPIST